MPGASVVKEYSPSAPAYARWVRPFDAIAITIALATGPSALSIRPFTVAAVTSAKVWALPLGWALALPNPVRCASTGTAPAGRPVNVATPLPLVVLASWSGSPPGALTMTRAPATGALPGPFTVTASERFPVVSRRPVRDSPAASSRSPRCASPPVGCEALSE